MLDDLSDSSRALRNMKKDVKRAPVRSAGDSSHSGAGPESVQLGPDADASGSESIAVGDGAIVSGAESTGVGPFVYVTGERSTGVGAYVSVEHDSSAAFGNNAGTTAAWQVVLGTPSHTVVVPGVFSNPSARHLKQNIEPAPVLADVFPRLYEYEYKSAPDRSRLGFIADELVGTGAERFVVFDDDGLPSGIDYVGLLVLQVARLHARVVELESGVA